MTELTDLNDTDALNTAVTGNSTEGNVANMGGMDNLFQATLGMLSRFRNANIFRLRDNTDNTKLLAFDLSGLTTATTRTLTAPDASGTIALVAPGYTTTATAAGTTTLTATSNLQQYFTGTTTQIVVLPVTSTLVLGQQFRIVNNSTGNVTVQSSGANAIAIVGPGTACVFTCILTSGTTAASWDFKFGGTLTRGTAQASTSGTAISFTSVIPAWAKRITVNLVGVSTNGSDAVGLRLGTGGVYATTGYLAGAGDIVGAAAVTNTVMFPTQTGGNAAHVRHGRVTFDLVTGNTWVASGIVALSNTAQVNALGGSIDVVGVVDSVQVTTTPGANTFDAGTINISWE